MCGIVGIKYADEGMVIFICLFYFMLFYGVPRRGKKIQVPKP